MAPNSKYTGCECLKVLGQSTPKPTGVLTKVLCTSGPNLVILDWTHQSIIRTSSWLDPQTNTGNDNTRGLKWVLNTSNSKANWLQDTKNTHWLQDTKNVHFTWSVIICIFTEVWCCCSIPFKISSQLTNKPKNFWNPIKRIQDIDWTLPWVMNKQMADKQGESSIPLQTSCWGYNRQK